MMVYSSLGILLIALGASALCGRSFGIRDTRRSVKAIFFFSIVAIVAELAYQAYQQYVAWSENPLSQFLLPPYRGWSYFLFYVRMRIFASYAVSLVVAGIVFCAMKALNRRYGERFFYEEEYWFVALAVFLSGHPGWLIYLIFILLIYVCIHIISSVVSRWSLVKERRISFYHLWLPTAIFVILMTQFYLAQQGWWKLLAI